MRNKGIHCAKAKRLSLPIGNSDWAEVKAGYWLADKTQLISGLLDRKTTVALFTRPRRFGKTFALEMLHTFFEKTEKSNAPLFKGTKVWKDAAYRAEQGKYPVLHITLKDAKGSDWAETRDMIANAVADEYIRHAEVFSRKDCPTKWSNLYNALQFNSAPSAAVMHSLGILAAALHAYHGEKPVILIDEYDSPINWAATHGFGKESLQFIRNFLSSALKDGKHCRLGVMTGILRIAKEGVLSGLNNPKVYSVFDADFADCFGFTEAEVRELLATYGHPEKMDEAKAWYDGYRFGGREMYNPWSLLNYVDDGFTPQLYWLDTSSNDLVADAMSRMTTDMRNALADFFENKEAEVPCSRELGRYGQIQNNPQIIWSLLVHTGYLKVLSGPDLNKRALLAFPNRELVSVFRDDILDPITCTPTVGSDLQGILSSLTNGNGERFRKLIERFLVSSASYYDTAKEDFFHGLVLGLLAIGRDYFEIRSNREEGDGRPDIMMKPLPGIALPGVILEFKSPKIPARASQKCRDAFLVAAARKAREQIDEKRYAAEMEESGIAVLKYGIGFSGKHVALAAE